MSSSLRICNRCVMDETVPDIVFYEDGRCSLCRSYDEHRTKELYTDAEGAERLERLVEDVRQAGKGKPYDCLIGLSGGVDSSYAAYLVAKKFGLRAIAIHLDNGWNTELAVDNVERIVKILGIDLSTHVLDWREFRDIQTAFMRSSISNIEIPTDHAIWAVLIKTAAKMGVKYIFAGNNVVTESIMPESWLYGSKDSTLIRAIHRQFGKVPMKSYPYLTTFDYGQYLLGRGIRWVPVLNYVPFVKSEAKQLLMDELGWRDYGGKHYESTFTRFFHAYYLPRKFGYDLRKSYYSALVCSGQLTREQALADLAKPPAPEALLEQDRVYVLKKLGLTDAEFEAIIAAPNKTYADYPNADAMWRRFDWLVRWARARITRV
ncbi:MAG: N-acetyl sugar amidotransferase [Minisyncoccota bacterium]